MPPIRPPRNGATQNSHSWLIAPAPANSATPVERAGFTEVLVTGMLIRWIRVSARPLPMPAQPAGARPVVAPQIQQGNEGGTSASHKKGGPTPQNQNSGLIAPAPANSATPVERAGFTEVLVTGMLIRWIRVSARPMAMPAKPAGARPWVAPMITMRKNAVITTSHRKAAATEYPCGDSAP